MKPLCGVSHSRNNGIADSSRDMFRLTTLLSGLPKARRRQSRGCRFSCMIIEVSKRHVFYSQNYYRLVYVYCGSHTTQQRTARGADRPPKRTVSRRRRSAARARTRTAAESAQTSGRTKPPRHVSRILRSCCALIGALQMFRVC